MRISEQIKTDKKAKFLGRLWAGVRNSQKGSERLNEGSERLKKGSERLKKNIKYNMVMKCERCQVDFKYASLLARHQARKTLCEKVEKSETCKYCRRPLSSKKTKHRHEQLCKYKDDYVRNLELELEIDIDINYEYSNDTCRFCDKVMRPNNLLRHECACKAKEIYKTKLQNMLRAHNTKQGKSGNTTINNTINNTNAININLRPFGKENVDHITPTYLLKVMDDARCTFAKEREKHRLARMLYRAIHANPEIPENHNMLIPSLKGSTALVYTQEGFEHIHRKIAENQVLGTLADVTFTNLSLKNEDENEEDNRLKCRQKYKRFVDNFIEGEETYDDETDMKRNAQNRQTIAQASYDSRDIVKETHRKVGKVSLENVIECICD